MVATASTYTNSRYRAYAGEGYDGVVRISANGYYGTGALLFDGRAILTAAHLVNSNPGSVRVTFETSAGSTAVDATQILVHPAYDSINDNNDLALIWLNSAAPSRADRYTLYRSTDQIGQTFTMVGYGQPGTGSGGVDNNYSGNPLRLMAQNTFDADVSRLSAYLSSYMGWSPLAGSQLIADFDDGSSAHDALGRLTYLSDLGLGIMEGLITPGDSGGPAFIDGKLAGVASYRTSLSRGSTQPDTDGTTNSSYGEIASWAKLSYYQQWIDQSLRAHYPNAPTQASEVQTSITEGNSSSLSYAYFLLQFSGTRSTPDERLSVDYQTRDGTATAGQDYLAASGTLVLYPDETQAVIPVEIIGDNQVEGNEVFYLDVTNPLGGSFGEGIIKLTAMRTIVDDDNGSWGWGALG